MGQIRQFMTLALNKVIDELHAMTAFIPWYPLDKRLFIKHTLYILVHYCLQTDSDIASLMYIDTECKLTENESAALAPQKPKTENWPEPVQSGSHPHNLPP
jgi:hypothetical protein